MGMQARCTACGHTERSDNRRGARLGTCPRCGGQMRGHTAGKAQGRYLCPIQNHVVTLGLTGIQLDQPMQLVFTLADQKPRPWDQEYLDRTAGKVFGPGCVVSAGLTEPDPFGQPKALLIPAPTADPTTWFVNEQVRYITCAACGVRVVDRPENRAGSVWRPSRATVWVGRGATKRKIVTHPGPHAAGTPACSGCLAG